MSTRTRTLRFADLAALLLFIAPLSGCAREDSQTTVNAVEATASAELSESEQESAASILRSMLALRGTLDTLEDNSVSPNRLAAICLILKHTHELEIHRMQGATTNQVYLHEDGHREAVFDSNHKLVQDGVNDGSYNYFHPSNDPLRHFTFDIAPWILWGQTPDDPTSVQQRVHAYAADVSQGVKNALDDAKQSNLLPVPELVHTGSPEAIAVFLKAMQLDEGEDVADLFDVDAHISDERIASAVKRLEHGLREVFGNAPVGDLQ